MKYSNFANSDYMKKNLTLIDLKSQNKQGGIPIIWKDDNQVYIPHDNHTLLIGGAGSGKTQSVILPTIKITSKTDESMIIYDVKGELYEQTAEMLKENGYKTIIINYSNPKASNCYNPLSFPYELYKGCKTDEVSDIVENVGYYLLSKDKDLSDPFWTNMAVDLFTGVTLYLFDKANEEQINITNVANFIMKLNDSDDSKKLLKELDKKQKYYLYLKEVLSTPEDTRNSIIAVTNQMIKPYVFRENMARMMSISEFNFKELLEEKFAIFLIGNGGSVGSLVPMFIEQIYSSLGIFNKSKKIKVILDEFDSLKPIIDFSSKLLDARHLGMTFLVVSKSYANLINQYGKENFEILKLCFNDLIYLSCNDLKTREDISKLCGKQNKDMLLISADELRTLKQYEAVIVLHKLMPYKVKLIPDYKIKWDKEYKKTKLEERELPEINYYE